MFHGQSINWVPVSESMSSKKKNDPIRWITETVAQPFIRFQIRTVHIPFDYRHSCRVWVLLVASSLKSDWHRLLVYMCMCDCFWGDFKLRCWYIFRLIFTWNIFWDVYVCIFAINAISLAFTRIHWWEPLHICTSLAFDAYVTQTHHTHTFIIICVPCVILFYVHFLNVGVAYQNCKMKSGCCYYYCSCCWYCRLFFEFS